MAHPHTPPATKAGPGSLAGKRDQWLHVYEQMLTIRLFEEQVNELYTSARMPGLAHLYSGEEAIAVGVCEALRRDDYITSTHRGHGHCLAKGASVDLMFAELLGKEAGYCRGKGGSMHIADQETGNLGANAIVGGSAGIATGSAFSSKMRGSDQVTVCFFGDGALGQGVLYEAMNMAALWKLPIIYVCENNLYNEYTHISETTAGDLSARPRRLAFTPRSLTARMWWRSMPPPSILWTGRARAKGQASCSAIPIAITATMLAIFSAPIIAPKKRSRNGAPARPDQAAGRAAHRRKGRRRQGL